MKKIAIILVSCIMGIGILLTGCSDNKNNQSSTNSQEEGNVLAESPLLGEWTLNKTSTAAGSATMAEMIYGKLYSEPDVFNFKDDGTIESQTNEFNLTQFTWGCEDEKYYLYKNNQKWEIDYKDDTISFNINDASFELIKGAKSAEELLKAEGLWHEDELEIVNASVESIRNGFFVIKYEIRNNTSENLTFKGISIDEYNIDDVQIKSYKSYNKNATFFEIAPGDSGVLELTFAYDSGITKAVTNSYEYENADGVLISGSFSTPYEVTGIQ